MEHESIRWILEISISIMSIGVTTILGIQIWNALTISKLIDKKLEREKSLLKKEIAEHYSKSKHISSSLSSFNIAYTSEIAGKITPAFHAYMQAILSANAAGAEDICEMYIGWLKELLKKAATEKTPIEITPQQRLEYVSALADLESDNFKSLRSILVGDENAFFKYP